MAARRLLIIMFILLGVSILAAALADPRLTREAGTASTIAGDTETEAGAATGAETGVETTGVETDATPAGTVPIGKRLGLSVTVGGGRVKVIPISVGDQLALTVSSRKTGLLEIPAFGLLEPVAPNAPARFDLLAAEPGNYGIRFVEADRVVARIEVSKRDRAPGSPSGAAPSAGAG